ncbi:S-layer homology domain-containing protein [Pontibacillus yanchengensis]|uniref:SLH domain-containing protein n=1 Tax=Pontibacillus yanchengensis Y32 TaxID=1385514 RepID=A0A0A2TB34_9BACI|nr:S-layer homology domain-containing protein [Pontibacillus yanchengensis]KGP72749.1 hypothetical protein N782_10695 [Pontibacillus yanchengensis Y32]
MKRFQTLFFCGLVLLCYLVLSMYHHIQAEEEKSAGYLVLGDDWARGLLGNGGMGEGYVGLISQAFEREGYHIYVDHPYPKPYLTSSELLTQLEGKAVQQGISLSDFITISIGLSDIQKLLTVEEDASVGVRENVLTKSLQKVEFNVNESIDIIQKIQPQAEVYVFGYATPDVPSFMKDITKDLILQLNKTLEKSTDGKNNVSYVKAPTYIPMEKSSVTLLPNEKIYNRMAKAFLQTYSERHGLSFQSTDSEWKWGDEESYEKVMKYAKSMHSLKAITREEAIYFFKYLAPHVEKPQFTYEWKDIQVSHELYPLLVSMTDMQIIRKSDFFNPKQPITRAEMVAILARALDVPPTISPLFTDIPSNHWANHYITGLAEIGILNGYPDGSFRPDQEVSGTELYRIWERIVREINFSK